MDQITQWANGHKLFNKKVGIKIDIEMLNAPL